MSHGHIFRRDEVITREEELRLALEAMVAAYDRMAKQFPERTGARAMLDGAFLKPVVQSKKLLGHIA